MSASAPTLARKLPQGSTLPTADPPGFRILCWVTMALSVSSIVLIFPFYGSAAREHSLEAVAWVPLVAVADLGAVSGRRELRLGFGLPLLLAVTFLFGPVAGGLVALLGSIDARELRRQISLGHALFNRAQISLSVLSA